MTRRSPHAIRLLAVVLAGVVLGVLAPTEVSAQPSYVDTGDGAADECFETSYQNCEPDNASPPTALDCLAFLPSTDSFTSPDAYERWYARYDECMAEANEAVHAYLPAWRWRASAGLSATPGWRDFMMVALSGLASLLFLLASFLWWVLLLLLRFGTSVDVLAAGAASINRGFAAVADGVNQSGILYVLVLVGALVGLKLLMSGKLTRALSMALTVIVPFAVLFAMTAATADGRPDPTVRGIPAGSPAWIGVKGVEFVDTFGTNIAEGFGRLDPGSRIASTMAGEEPTICDMYVNRLYELNNENEAAMAVNPYDYSPEKFAEQAKLQASAVGIVSMLWQRAYLTSWMSAQYGSVDSAKNIYCFELERRARVPAAEQQEIYQEATGWRAPNTANFDRLGSDKTMRARLFMWAACTPNGGAAQVQPGWEGEIGNVDGDTCAAWFDRGEIQRLEWADKDSIDSELEDALEIGGTLGDNPEAVAAYDLVVAYWGHNSAQRVVEAVVALITAAVYLYTLGGIAVGSIIAQYGLMAMLILLPVTLLMLAVPSASGRKNTVGVKMLKITGGFFFAKMALVLVLTLLIQLITLFESITPSQIQAPGEVSSGAVSSLMHAFIPLAALFLLRKLLQMAGIGDITKLSGSLGLAAAATAAATGDRSVRAAMGRGIAGLGSRVDMDRQSRQKRLYDRINRRSARDKMSELRAERRAQLKDGMERRLGDGRIREGLTPLIGSKDGNTKGLVGRTGDRARAGTAGLVAGALGRITGHTGVDDDGNPVRRFAGDGVAADLGGGKIRGAFARGAGNAQKFLGERTALRGAYQKMYERQQTANQAVNNQQLLLEQSRSRRDALKGKTAAERHGAQRDRVMGAIGSNQEQVIGHIENTLGPDAAADYRAQLAGGGQVALAPEHRLDLIAGAAGMYSRPDQMEGHIVCGNEGLRAVVLGSPGRPDGQGNVRGRFDGFPGTVEDLALAVATNPEALLAPELQARRSGETENEHHARLLALTMAAGLRDADGTPVNLLEMHGLRSGSGDTIVELQKALAGEPSRLDSIVVRPSTEDVAAVNAAIRERYVSSERERLVMNTAALSEIRVNVETLGDATKDVALQIDSSVADTRARISQAVSSGAPLHGVADQLVVNIESLREHLVDVMATTYTLANDPRLEGAKHAAEWSRQLDDETRRLQTEVDSVVSRVQGLSVSLNDQNLSKEEKQAIAERLEKMAQYEIRKLQDEAKKRQQELQATHTAVERTLTQRAAMIARSDTSASKRNTTNPHRGSIPAGLKGRDQHGVKRLTP